MRESLTHWLWVAIGMMIRSMMNTEGWMAPRKPFQGPPGNFGRSQNHESDGVNALWNQTSVVEKEDAMSALVNQDDDDYEEALEVFMESLPGDSKQETVEEGDRATDEHESNDDLAGNKASAQDTFDVKGIVRIGELDQ